MTLRHGDGFKRCSDGHVRWGHHGAAGVLYVVREPDGPVVMLQQRSSMAHEGGTWSVPGGALDAGEQPLAGALRESDEEVGPPSGPIRVIGSYVFAPADDWIYTTAVVEVDERFGEPMNFETAAIDWVPLDAVDRRPLHAGFAAAWPSLRAIVESQQPLRG